MTRKHYRQVAEMLKREIETYEHDVKTVASIADSLATFFQADNPRFDRDKFLQAVGLGQ
jgi:hypothetical protein